VSLQLLFIKVFTLGVVAHAFTPTRGGRGRRISEFEASLVYRVSSRTARATQRNPVSKNQKPKKKKVFTVELCLYSYCSGVRPTLCQIPACGLDWLRCSCIAKDGLELPSFLPPLSAGLTGMHHSGQCSVLGAGV
jgi:hypothetical protein